MLGLCVFKLPNLEDGLQSLEEAGCLSNLANNHRYITLSGPESDQRLEKQH